MKCLNERQLEELCNSRNKVSQVLKRQHLKQCEQCTLLLAEVEANLKLQNEITSHFKLPK